MKKLLVLVLISALVFGCKKDIQEDPVATNEAEVSFQINLLDPGSTKDWPCPVDENGNILEPDYAEIDIFDGTTTTTYKPLVYRIDGLLYTQNLKLDLPDPNATLSITEFLLWDDQGTPHDYSNDLIVMGVPAASSEYEIYINALYRLEYEIDVQAFTKFQYEIEVLCFIPDLWEGFGFDWFEIYEIVIREECFFGDICIKHPADYSGSNYENQLTGLQLDMPAIVEIHVYDVNGVAVPYSPFTNNNSDANWGVGAPVCINWPDKLWIPDETFTVEIWILVVDGNADDGFAFKKFWTGTMSELGVLTGPDGVVNAGDDGIIEFVLGECNLMSTDIQLPPYQHLPASANIDLAHPGNPGYWYLDINYFNGDPTLTDGFDIVTGNLQTAFCGDASTTITPGSGKVADVYSSLYNWGWPSGFPWTLAMATQVNWLFNHLDYYGIDVTNFDQAEGLIIQDAIWNIVNIGYTGYPFGGTTAQQMAADAIGHTGYQPLPGGWAAVLFNWEITENVYSKQLILQIVDP